MADQDRSPRLNSEDKNPDSEDKQQAHISIDATQDMEWDVSPSRNDIPKVTVKSNDRGTLRVFMGCLVARSSYFTDFTFDGSDIELDFSFQELKLVFELMTQDMDKDKFNRENALSLFRISHQYGIDDIQRRALQFIVDDSDSEDISFDMLVQYWLIVTKHKQAEAKEDSDVSNRLQAIRKSILTRFGKLLQGDDRDAKRIIPGDPKRTKEFIDRLRALNSGKKWAHLNRCYGIYEFYTEPDSSCERVCFNWVKEARNVIERNAARFLIEQTTDHDLPEIKNLFSAMDTPAESEFVVGTQDRALLCRMIMSLL